MKYYQTTHLTYPFLKRAIHTIVVALFAFDPIPQSVSNFFISMNSEKPINSF